MFQLATFDYWRVSRNGQFISYPYKHPCRPSPVPAPTSATDLVTRWSLNLRTELDCSELGKIWENHG